MQITSEIQNVLQKYMQNKNVIKKTIDILNRKKKGRNV